jgi:hypothetical protein
MYFIFIQCSKKEEHTLLYHVYFVNCLVSFVILFCALKNIILRRGPWPAPNRQRGSWDKKV